jgi:antitoxin (DNA-binding transcriptional repressor) of toxin-antitoxin stability system
LCQDSVAENSDVDGDTNLVSISNMRSITSKELHEQTGALLDRVKQGQRFRVLRRGEADALLVPATDQVDPPWDEIIAEVRKARTQHKPLRPNPVLAERRKRHYAAGVRR